MRTPEDAPTDPDRLIRLGTIASVDLANARATVTLADGAITPPLKWIEARAGDTRTWSPPSVGEQVELRCPGGELAGALIQRGIPSTANPPAGNSTTELIKFKDGAVLSYDPQSHALTFALPDGGTLAITADVTITGNVHITKTLTADTDAIAAGISLKNHVHKNVQPGSGLSGGPQ